MPDEKDLNAEIVAEIQRAVVRLGGSLEDLPEVPTPGACSLLLHHLGADRYLLGTVGSWKDTQTDEDTLDSLRRLNEGRSLFDSLIATRKDD